MQVAVETATAPQLETFLRIAGLDVPPQFKGDLANLLELHRSSKLPDTLYLPDDVPSSASPASVKGLDELFTEELTNATERWIRIRLGGDLYGEDKNSIVPISCGNSSIWLPRNKDIVVRERFVRVLNDSRERRMRQANGDGSGKFSEGEHYEEHRHPFSLVAVLGLVTAGKPTDLPHGVEVIS